MSLLHDIGPSTTIKASTTAPRMATRTHCGGQLGLWWPRVSPGAVGWARCSGRSPRAGHWHPQLAVVFTLGTEMQVSLGDGVWVACFMMGGI